MALSALLMYVYTKQKSGRTQGKWPLNMKLRLAV